MREPIHIPAGRAWLCHDCNAVGNSGISCPACASASVYPLLSLLDGKRAPESAPCSDSPVPPSYRYLTSCGT